MHSQSQNKVVFMDRDGVINHDSPNYIKSWSEFKFIPGSIEAIRLLTLHNFIIIIITNQSGINRKLIPVKELMNMHANLKEAVSSSGGIITDIFYCPHTPEENCDCRKPKPGLILKAKQLYDVNLSSAYMIGDSAKDIECANRAGLCYNILVETGNGVLAKKEITKKGMLPDYTAKDLCDAALWIIKKK